jgi:hypothetical protein
MKSARALRLLIVTLIAPGLCATPALAQGGSPAAARELSGQHPAEYYKRAAELFEKGSKEDAVFLFYLGQLRFRTHLLAHPGIDPTGDPAIFASLSKVVGVPINQYAFGDIPALGRTVDAVLAYDEANPDTFTPTAETAKARADVRSGLAAMKVNMLAEADAIRAKRQKSGLENR